MAKDKVRTLLIDDSRAVHAFVRDCLKTTCLDLTEVYNGREGLEKLAKGEFDLILLDWEMPEMDGPATLREIRKRGLKTPVLMLTARNSVDDITSMIGLGVADYIMKPFTADILVGKVEAVLGKDVGSHAAA